MENGNRVLYGRFGCYSLNGLDYDALGFLVGGQLGFVHDFVDVALGGGFCFVLEAFNEFFFCFFGAEAAEVFEGVDCRAVHLVEFGFLFFADCELGVEVVAGCLVFVFGALVFALLLVELKFALLSPGFRLLNLLQALVGLLFGFGCQACGFFFALADFVFFQAFGFDAGLVDYCLGARAGH